MKKTIIALLALGSVAMGDSVVTGLTDFNAKQTGADIKLADKKDTLTMSITGGKSWTLSPSDAGGNVNAPMYTWTNTAAIETMNKELGQSFTSADFGGVPNYQPVGCGQGGSWTDLTLDITSLEVGSDIVIYALGTAAGSDMDNFNVSGLENLTISYAVVEGNGFSLTENYTTPTATTTTNDQKTYMTQWGYTLFRVTGTLTDEDIVLSARAGNKNLWGMVAYGSYAPIPEPTTATLSLLALAGLAARRRRK